MTKYMTLDGTEVSDVTPYLNRDFQYLMDQEQTLLTDESSVIYFLKEISDAYALSLTSQHLQTAGAKCDFNGLKESLRRDLKGKDLRDQFDDIYRDIPNKLNMINKSGHSII